MKNLNINPLFLLLMSITILFISIYSLNIANKNIIQEKTNFLEYKLMAVEYSKLKKSWSNIDNQKNIINKVILSSRIKNASINMKNDVIKVKIKNISTKKLNSFVNKILNKKLNISKFYLNNNSIEFEVK